MTVKHRRKKMAHELPPAGTVLQGRFKGETYTAIIVEAEGSSGKRIRLGDHLYPSLSSAAKAITGHPINGWRFWQPVGQDPQ